MTLQSCNIHDVFRNSIPFPGFEVKAIPDFVRFSKPLGPFDWSVIGQQHKYIQNISFFFITSCCLSSRVQRKGGPSCANASLPLLHPRNQELQEICLSVHSSRQFELFNMLTKSFPRFPSSNPAENMSVHNVH